MSSPITLTGSYVPCLNDVKASEIDHHEDDNNNANDDSRGPQSIEFFCLWRTWHRPIARLNCTNIRKYTWSVNLQQTV